MNRGYYISYAISFKYIPNKKDGEIHHNWFFCNIAFKTSSNLRDEYSLAILREKLLKRHNCKFVQIISIFKMQCDIFLKGKKIEDVDFCRNIK
jgi:hypothetical protein